MTRSHEIEKLIWVAMAWALENADALPKTGIPGYTETGNSDAELMVRIVAQRVRNLPQPPGPTQPAEAQTVRTELKDGNLVILENYRPKLSSCQATPNELRNYALKELNPFVELAEQGRLRALVVAAEMDDNRLNITYPVGQWEPGLIAGTVLLQRRLLDQGT